MAGEGTDCAEVAVIFGEDDLGLKVTAEHHVQSVCEIEPKIAIGVLHALGVDQTSGSEVGEDDSPGGSVGRHHCR